MKYVYRIASVALLLAGMVSACTDKKKEDGLGAYVSTHYGDYHDEKWWSFVESNKNPGELVYKCDGPRVLLSHFKIKYDSDWKASGLGDIKKPCDELPIHESRAFAWLPGLKGSGPGLPTVYKITRVSRTEYEIAIPVEYQPACDSAEFISKRIGDKWRARVQSCLDEAAPLMRGPSGENIHLKIEEVSPTQGIYFVVQALDTAEEIRADAGLLAPPESCAIILHETIHLLGLVDEYKVKNKDIYDEPLGGKRYVYEMSCRSGGPSNSMMNDHYLAWVHANRDGANLLYPGEGRAILYPGCSAKNSIYYQCSRSAYSSDCSKEEKRPEQCDNEVWITGVLAPEVLASEASSPLSPPSVPRQ